MRAGVGRGMGRMLLGHVQDATGRIHREDEVEVLVAAVRWEAGAGENVEHVAAPVPERVVADLHGAGPNGPSTLDGFRGFGRHGEEQGDGSYAIHTVKPGLVSLAEKSGAPVVPIRVTYGWKVRARSWDRFQVPLPFSRMRVVLGKPVTWEPDGAEARIRAALGE